MSLTAISSLESARKNFHELDVHHESRIGEKKIRIMSNVFGLRRPK